MSAALETVKMATTRLSKGQGTDQELLEVISRRPGLSKYELARAVKWSMGKTDGAVVRLLKRRLVYLMVLERGGRRVNLIYPVGYVEPDFIRVSWEGLPLNQRSGVMYALDSTTIGVAWDGNDEWGSISFLRKTIPLEVSGGDVVFRIPDEFRRFYGLDRRHYVVSVNPGGVLITVAGEIRRA